MLISDTLEERGSDASPVIRAYFPDGRGIVVSRLLPVFPLGTVVLPGAGIPLHVFEERYRTLMRELTDGTWDPPEFGIVLVERGSEVGGGDERASVGTVVQALADQQLPDGRWVLIAGGTRRFRVERWLPDAPYPRAEVEELDTETWDPSWATLLEEAGRHVRRARALAVELGEASGDLQLPPTDDPRVETWQLCAVAPLGPFDRQELLEAVDGEDRLRRLARLAADAADALAFRLSAGA
jgi:uncharacterized protein